MSITLRVPEEQLAKRIILRVPELALVLGLSEGNIEQMLARGQIPCRKLGRRRIVLVDELLAHLRSLPLVRPDKVFCTRNGDA